MTAQPRFARPRKSPAAWAELEQLSNEDLQRFILKELQSISANIRFFTILMVIAALLAVLGLIS